VYILRRRTPRGFRYYGLGAMNCPGDPGCPGNPLPADMTDVLTSLPLTGPYTTGTGQAAVALAEGGSQAAVPGTITDWLNSNGKTVAIGAAVFLFVPLLFRGRR
jgi:hypothetical protein